MNQKYIIEIELTNVEIGMPKDSMLAILVRNLDKADADLRPGQHIEIRKIIEEDWAATEEGQQAIQESKERGQRFAERIKKDMTIDREKLNRPFTR